MDGFCVWRIGAARSIANSSTEHVGIDDSAG